MDERVGAIYSVLSQLFCCPVQVRDLEERLVEKEHELKQMKRNLDESEGAIVQVNLIVFVCSPPLIFIRVCLFSEF